jgi:hypothetical protein
MAKLNIGFFFLGVMTTLTIVALAVFQFEHTIYQLSEKKAIDFSRKQKGNIIIVIGHSDSVGVKRGRVITGNLSKIEEVDWHDVVLASFHSEALALTNKNAVLETIRAKDYLGRSEK